MTGTLQGQVQAPQARSYLHYLVQSTELLVLALVVVRHLSKVDSRILLTVSLLDYDTVRALLDLQYATYHLPAG